jgi:hypothetical protein
MSNNIYKNPKTFWNMLNKLDIFRKDNENLSTDIIELGTDALCLLGHFNRLTNLSRRDLHRPGYSFRYVISI